MREHRIPIAMPRDLNDREMKKARTYRAYAAEIKKKSFVRKELTKQLQVGHISVLPLKRVRNIKGLWLPPLAYTIHTGRKSRLVYNFSWSGLNARMQKAAPKDAMVFGIELHRLLD